MKRINVIGTTGSGKTTFSKQLSSALGIPHVQLDQLFWKANWVESSEEEFLSKVKAAVREDTWVLDGNFNRTRDIKWPRTDTVIWLDFSYFTTFAQLLNRTLRRAITKDELWPNTGNRESFRKSFFTRSSILLWFLQTYHRHRKEYLHIMQSNDFPHIHFVHLRDRKEARNLIAQLQSQTRDLHSNTMGASLTPDPLPQTKSRLNE